MTLWEKTLINLNKGYEKLTGFAAVFSERVKAEISIVLLRLQIDELQKAIREEQYAIGRKLVEMREEETMPSSFEAFFSLDEVAASLEAISLHEKALDGLLDDLNAEADVLRNAPRRKGGEGAA